jgi:hypothetical protein
VESITCTFTTVSTATTTASVSFACTGYRCYKPLSAIAPEGRTVTGNSGGASTAATCACPWL